MTTERQAPADWMGTYPEYLVYQQLVRMVINFDYQSSQLGGRSERGGLVLDFYIPSLSLALNVQSTYWHYGRPEARQADRIQREALEAQGLRVVYLDEEDLIRNAKYYVTEALEGRDHSLASKGVI